MDNKGRTPPPPPRARSGDNARRDRDGSGKARRREATRPGMDTAESEESRHRIDAEPVARTAGADGITRIHIDWIDVQLGGNVSCRFRIRTDPEHALQATLKQNAWEQQLEGTGTLETGVVPVAGIGVTGLLTVRDAVTGETAEQGWYWYRIGLGSLLGALWRLIKRMFTRRTAPS